MLDVDHLRYDYELYLGEWRDHSDPRVSPLMFDDLTGAPPAIVVVASAIRCAMRRSRTPDCSNTFGVQALSSSKPKA